MELIKITDVSRILSISTRTLRYYEEIGLIESLKTEGYAYRTYDEFTVRRLQQIIALRKLRISLKEIDYIFKNNDLTHLINVFQDNIKNLDEEINALNNIVLLQKHY